MDISVSTNMGFENRENQQNVQKHSQKHVAQATTETVQESSPRIISGLGSPWNSKEIAELVASTQMTLNGSLKETLNYLKRSRNNSKMSPIFGELWEELENEPDEYLDFDEIIDYIIDKKIKNIFEAA